MPDSGWLILYIVATLVSVVAAHVGVRLAAPLAEVHDGTPLVPRRVAFKPSYGPFAGQMIGVIWGAVVTAVALWVLSGRRVHRLSEASAVSLAVAALAYFVWFFFAALIAIAIHISLWPAISFVVAAAAVLSLRWVAHGGSVDFVRKAAAPADVPLLRVEMHAEPTGPRWLLMAASACGLAAVAAVSLGSIAYAAGQRHYAGSLFNIGGAMWAVPVYVVAAIAGAMTGCALIWRPEERDRVPMRAKVLAIVIAIVAMVVSLYMVGALGQSGSDAVHWVAVAVPACAGAGAIVAVYRMAYE